MNQYDFWDQGMALAVSGGSDSVAMLVLMVEWLRDNKRHEKYRVLVLTIDHWLSKEAREAANMVVDLCGRYGVEVHVLRDKNCSFKGGNRSVYTRRLRYSLIMDFCYRENIKNIFIAHNKDDQIATFYLNMIRGSGIDGLSAMLPFQLKSQLRFMRPLLDFYKKDLVDFLRMKSVDWAEDSINSSTTRYRYRRILRAFPELNGDRIIKSICHIQRAREAIVHCVLEAFKSIVTVDLRGFLKIDAACFDNLTSEVAMRVLVSSLMIVGGRGGKPRFSTFEAVFRGCYKSLTESVSTLYGCVIVKKKCSILILREIVAISDDIELKSGADVVWDNRLRFSLQSTVGDLDSVFVGKSYATCKFTLSDLEGYVTAGLPVLKDSGRRVLCPVFGGTSSRKPDVRCYFDVMNILNEVLYGGVL